MATRWKLTTALILVVAVIGVLIRTAVTHASSYYVTVHQLTTEGRQAIGQKTTVSGEIVGSSVHWLPAKSLLTFTMKDKSSNNTIPVTFHGAKPDDFSNNWPVIVSGTMGKNGQFEASKLLIKCPSKYKAKGQTKTYKASPTVKQ
ncbi:cytochrome c maturation protein CcmE [Alicyclobacillus sp. SO9]|uniref:cytochrome c maturation protein CcmE n=1 Tax=Alicyclobacillus sp. SO9 TaxID=2665646 RepID=UPI0018E7DB6B|nr:cytochrome c maturation protein CcmE [Alicyclobacillus sp. SO9]QQE76940.1 cytochrome c maturation protein CcmE [Alicyclobacillus sp. SO9]